MFVSRSIQSLCHQSPGSKGSKGEPGQGDITRCDTRLRVTVTTVPLHQSHLSDRCWCVCVCGSVGGRCTLRMVIKDRMQEGDKQSFKVHHWPPLLLFSFSAVNLLDTTTYTGDWGWLTYPSHGVRTTHGGEFSAMQHSKLKSETLIKNPWFYLQGQVSGTGVEETQLLSFSSQIDTCCSDIPNLTPSEDMQPCDFSVPRQLELI